MAETSYIIQNGRRLNLKDSTARKSIGSCDNLHTETKHCLVDAINELNEKVGGGGGGTSLDGLEATVEELNSLDGISGNVQEQLDAKAPSDFISASLGASTDEEILTDLDAVIAGMEDGTVKFVRVSGKVGTFLNDRVAVAEVFRAGANYCTVKMSTYTGASGGSVTEYNNSKHNGVWQGWTRNYSTGYKPKLTDLGLTATAAELNVLDGGMTESKISHSEEGSWSNAVSPFSSAKVDRSRANRFSFLPADYILVEWSTDDGATWEEVTTFASANKVNLITSSIGSGALPLGATLSASMRLRVTLTAPTSTRANLRQIYTEINTQGHGVQLDIEAAQKSAPDTFSVLRENVILGGWSGPNMINIPSIRWGVAANADYIKIRFIYKLSAVSSTQTGRPSVMSIKGYGDHAWYTHSNLALNDHLYQINQNGDAIFPADLRANTIAGVTPTEIGYLAGTTGNVQEQLNKIRETQTSGAEAMTEATIRAICT